MFSQKKKKEKKEEEEEREALLCCIFLSNFNFFQFQKSVITFNLWFDAFKKKERAVALFEIFRTHSPDFLCLQEVTTQVCSLPHSCFVDPFFLFLISFSFWNGF